MYLSYPLVVDARVRGHDEALAHYEQAARLFRMTGNVRGQAQMANNQGRVYQSRAAKAEGGRAHIVVRPTTLCYATPSAWGRPAPPVRPLTLER